jgi:hypothetical protein
MHLSHIAHPHNDGHPHRRPRRGIISRCPSRTHGPRNRDSRQVTHLIAEYPRLRLGLRDDARGLCGSCAQRVGRGVPRWRDAWRGHEEAHCERGCCDDVRDACARAQRGGEGGQRRVLQR